MILAAAAVLSYIDDPLAHKASQAIYSAAMEVVGSGTVTADLGGQASTTEFTDAVIARVARATGG
jgi:isocitrate/isopropylmalate dehydrogenase